MRNWVKSKNINYYYYMEILIKTYRCLFEDGIEVFQDDAARIQRLSELGISQHNVRYYTPRIKSQHTNSKIQPEKG